MDKRVHWVHFAANTGMKKPALLNTLVLVTALLFILLFTYTAVNKLLRFDGFAFSIRRIPGIPLPARTVAALVIAAELVAVLLLLINRLRKWGLLICAALMFIFSAYIIYMLVVDKNLTCSCGGVLRELSWRQHLVLNIVLGCAALWAFLYQRRPRSQ